jgi:hypothetical protein
MIPGPVVFTPSKELIMFANFAQVLRSAAIAMVVGSVLVLIVRSSHDRDRIADLEHRVSTFSQVQHELVDRQDKLRTAALQLYEATRDEDEPRWFSTTRGEIRPAHEELDFGQSLGRHVYQEQQRQR